MFGRGFDQPEPGRPLEHLHERRYTQPYDRWEPRDYVFYSGNGYHREFIEPFKVEGGYAGRGPRGYRRSDKRIEEEIVQRMTDHPDLDAGEIRIRVDDGEVTLEGAVSDRSARRLAEDIVETVRGVKDMHNRLRVGGGTGIGGGTSISISSGSLSPAEGAGEESEPAPGGDVRVAGPSSHSGTGFLSGAQLAGRRPPSQKT